MADAIDNEWVDGRSAIDIFVKKNNGVGYTYDDLILMPGALRCVALHHTSYIHNEAACCAMVEAAGQSDCRSRRLNNFDVEVA